MHFFFVTDMIPVIRDHGSTTTVDGLCPSRNDSAYQTDGTGLTVTPPHRNVSSFTSRSYCIVATVQVDSDNNGPLLYHYSGLQNVGNFSLIGGRIKYSLQGVTASFHTSYTSGQYIQVAVCIDPGTSRAILYMDCVEQERVDFIQTASGNLGELFFFGQQPFNILNIPTFKVSFFKSFIYHVILSYYREQSNN